MSLAAHGKLDFLGVRIRVGGWGGPEFMIHADKVYGEMRSPRFATKAEILSVKEWGAVVGMTTAHEADLCTAAGLNYNRLKLLDNYANGLEGTEIDFARFHDLLKSNQACVNRLFGRMLEILA
jgi:5'-methylthioadenosine phosphorylase